MAHIWLRCAVSSLAMAAVSLGQGAPANQPAQAQPAQAQPAPQPVARPVAPGFKSLIERDANGKVVRIEESLDLKALANNHMVSMEDRARLSPAVRAWMDDIDQLVIDNLDYLERIEPLDGSPGLFTKIDTGDAMQQKMIGSMMMMLMSSGQLTTAMQTKGLLSPGQAGMNNAMINEYLQAIMSELIADNGGNKQNLDAEAQKKQQAAVTGFLYYMTSRDAIEAYRRQLNEAAVVASEALAGMKVSGDRAGSLGSLASAAKSAPAGAERRKAMGALLGALSLDERRAFFKTARALQPAAKDPMAGLPPPPPAPGAMPGAMPPPAPNGGK